MHLFFRRFFGVAPLSHAQPLRLQSSIFEAGSALDVLRGSLIEELD